MRKVLVAESVSDISRAVASNADADAVIVAGALIPIRNGEAVVPAGVLSSIARGTWPPENLPSNVNDPAITFERAAGSVIVFSNAAAELAPAAKSVQKKGPSLPASCEEVIGKEKWAEFKSAVDSAIEAYAKRTGEELPEVDENTYSSVWYAIATANDAVVTFPFRLRLREVESPEKVGGALVDVYKQWKGFVEDTESGETRRTKVTLKKDILSKTVVPTPVPSTRASDVSAEVITDEEKVAQVCRFKFVSKRKDADIADRLGIKVEEVTAICDREKPNKEQWIERFRSARDVAEA